MICYSRSIIDYWRNRRTEEKGTVRQAKVGCGREMEEKMVWEDSGCCRTPPGCSALLHGLGTHVSIACHPPTHTIPLNPSNMYHSWTDGYHSAPNRSLGSSGSACPLCFKACSFHLAQFLAPPLPPFSLITREMER